MTKFVSAVIENELPDFKQHERRPDALEQAVRLIDHRLTCVDRGFERGQCLAIAKVAAHIKRKTAKRSRQYSIVVVAEGVKPVGGGARAN